MDFDLDRGEQAFLADPPTQHAVPLLCLQTLIVLIFGCYFCSMGFIFCVCIHEEIQILQLTDLALYL